MISVLKAGLGATVEKVQNGPFRVISPIRPRGGQPRHPPSSNTANETCDDRMFVRKIFPSEGYKNDLSTWLAYLINFDMYFDVKLAQLT